MARPPSSRIPTPSHRKKNCDENRDEAWNSLNPALSGLPFSVFDNGSMPWQRPRALTFGIYPRPSSPLCLIVSRAPKIASRAQVFSHLPFVPAWRRRDPSLSRRCTCATDGIWWEKASRGCGSSDGRYSPCRKQDPSSRTTKTSSRSGKCASMASFARGVWAGVLAESCQRRRT